MFDLCYATIAAASCIAKCPLEPQAGPPTSVALFLHLELHLGDAAVDHAELFGGGMRDVDHPPGDERAAIVDPDCDGLPGGNVGNAQEGPERQRPVRGGQFAGVELLPARSLRAMLVEARNPDRAIC